MTRYTFVLSLCFAVLSFMQQPAGVGEGWKIEKGSKMLLSLFILLPAYFDSKSYVSVGNAVIGWLPAGMECVHGLFEAARKIKQFAPPWCDSPDGAGRAGRLDPLERGQPRGAAAASCPCKAQGRAR